MSILEKSRNYGVDILKIVAMLMIIILHLEGHGGLLKEVKFSKDALFFSNYSVAWFLEVLSFCAVNCYALTSGYLSWNSDVKYSKLLYLFIQIIFYSLLITFVFSFFININHTEWFNSFFPITTKKYWYATAYFGMFILIPLLNSYFKVLTDKQIKKNLIVLFLFFSILPTFLRKDPYTLGGGYTMIWLCLMYLLGGFFSKYKVGSSINRYYFLVCFFAMVIITWGNKLGVEYYNAVSLDKINYYNLIYYTSPTIILSSVSLFLFFVNLNVWFKSTFFIKIISLLSASSFGVYLIHDNNIIRANFIFGYTKSFVLDNSFIMVIKIIVSAISIFLICAIIDILREYLFKLLKLPEATKLIDRFI